MTPMKTLLSRIGSEPVVANPSSFWNEARFQTTCAACGKARPFQAHHIVDKAILRNRCGLDGDALYDTRNALRLCQELGNPNVRCHFQHENSRRKVRTIELTDAGIVYAFEMLGLFGADYLRREYDDTEPDGRITEAEHILEAA